MTVGNFNEVNGTNGVDNLTGQDLQILYGLNGDDSLTANTGVAGADQVVWAVGGDGNDTYTVNNNTTLIVQEDGNSGADSIIARGISLNGANTEAVTIEGRHLLVRDLVTDQQVLIVDGEVQANRLESFELADGTFTFQQVLAAVNAASMGDFTFQELAAMGVLDFNRIGINPSDVDAALAAVDSRQNDLVQAHSIGDPHITTFDGLYYDFQAVGEFKLVESLDTGLEIQVRQDNPEGYDHVTVNTALATQLGDHRIELYAGETPQLEVDDVLVNLAPGEVQLVGPGRISLDSSEHESGSTILTYSINFGNGEKVVTHVYDSLGGYLDPYVSLYDNQQTEGLLGNFDGIADNDLQLANGSVISRPDDPLDLNGAYAETWQIDSNDLLFNDVMVA
ncbi:VWD domain-containing protein [Acaryochloris sp. CCMEE 5410]|uniref:VWD domain-containing protein n=1 Tax=Acaryochloris sp. CCMEE 5410 TaxID=310037 RepID=UPI000248452A|nr:VWD domain-containing protein [Acaryochloris sp. CCMEE 5410]KAI9134875.1 VWD domain-containing protein [Acaryochloris sp. CCMEE 5410]